MLEEHNAQVCTYLWNSRYIFKVATHLHPSQFHVSNIECHYNTKKNCCYHSEITNEYQIMTIIFFFLQFSSDGRY